MNTVEPGGPIVMVPSKSLEPALRALSRESPLLPADPGAIAARLNELNGPQGIPAAVLPARPGKDWSWVVYTPDFKVGFYLIPKSGAFRIGFVKPLNPRDRQDLAASGITVRPTEWRVARSDGNLPPMRRVDKTLSEAWTRLEQDKATRRKRSPLSARHNAYLDTLGGIVDASERIARATASNVPATAYRAKRSTGEQRHGKRSVYQFELVGRHQLESGMFVDFVGARDLRGQIYRIVSGTATVKFDRPIDWDAVPVVGELREAPNDVVFRSERQALSLLRSRKSRNPYLLDAIVDGKVRKIAETRLQPSRPLNTEQRQAFQKALTCEDLLVVHGPPGTGKTRTISEIASAAVLELNQKVLIASHSNRAVDNVLVGLPDHLEVLRIGYRDSITPDGLPFLLEERVAELRTRIQSATVQAMGPYADLDTAEAWLREFGTRVNEFAEGNRELTVAGTDRERAEAAVAARFEPRLDAACLCFVAAEALLVLQP